MKNFFLIFFIFIGVLIYSRNVQETIRLNCNEEIISVVVNRPKKQGRFPLILILHDDEINDIQGSIDILKNNYLSPINDVLIKENNILLSFLNMFFKSNLKIYEELAKRLSEDFVILRYEKKNFDFSNVNSVEQIIERPKLILNEILSKKFDFIDNEQIYLLAHGQGSYYLENLVNNFEISGIILVSPFILSQIDQIEYYLNYPINTIEKSEVDSNDLKDLEKVFDSLKNSLKIIDHYKNSKDINYELLLLNEKLFKHHLWEVYSKNITDFLFYNKIRKFFILGSESLIFPYELYKEYENNFLNSEMILLEGMNHFIDNDLKFESKIINYIKNWINKR